MTDLPMQAIGECCGSCRYWFSYGTPLPKNFAICNHPSVGGKGEAPMKRADLGCQKYEPRRNPDSNDPRDW